MPVPRGEGRGKASTASAGVMWSHASSAVEGQRNQSSQGAERRVP
jgi:hypothetical protein